MRFTFNIDAFSSPVVAPLCGAAAADLSRTQYGLKLTVDGTLVGDEPEGSFIGAVAGLVTTNGYVVDFQYLSNEFAAIDVSGLAIHESITVEFIVTKAGYNTFAKTFTFYGYDIGNFAPYSGNQEFEITLVPDTIPAGISETFFKALVVRRPLTLTTHVYFTHSGTFDTNIYDINGDLIGVNDLVVNVLPNQVTFGEAVATDAEGQCSITASGVQEPWLPTLITQATHSGCPTDDCFNILAQGQAFANLDFSGLYTVNVDNVEHYGFHGFTVDFSVIDLGGTETGQVTQLFQSILPVYSHDALGNPYVFAIPNVGDFLVKACFTIRDSQELYEAGTALGTEPILLQCCNSLKLEGCNWWSIKETDTCGTYEICNKSFETISYVVSKLNDDNVFEEVNSFEIDGCTCVSSVFTTQGIYKVEATRINDVGEAVTESLVVFNDCTFRECLKELIEDIICGGEKACDDCDNCDDKDYYNFNALVTMAHVYMGIRNNLYEFKFLYELFDTDALNSMYKASSILNRMLEYCEDCANPCSECN